MNANEKIFAIALASNEKPQKNFEYAISQISRLGRIDLSPIYLIPCRDGIGEEYWNAALLLHSEIEPEHLISTLKEMENICDRKRPSHQITLDIDLIAWGNSLESMQFNLKKMPLALDVKIPMYDIWPVDDFSHAEHHFPVI